MKTEGGVTLLYLPGLKLIQRTFKSYIVDMDSSFSFVSLNR